VAVPAPAQILPHIPLAQFTGAHLQQLVDLAIQESDVLEYKREMYGHSDDDTREMLRDITSMANHKGGHIIIGVEEDDDGMAKQLPGVNKGEHVQRITSSCLANIERRLAGIGIEDIELSTGRVAIVIRVPQSLNAPHMITYKGLNQFWRRHGRQKDKMSIDEIQEAFEKVIDAETRLERFVAERRRRVLANEAKEKPCLMLTATPLFLKQEIVDISDKHLRRLLTEAPLGPVGSAARASCGVPRPTLHGLRAAERWQGGSDVEYLELHRSGHLEFATRSYWEHDSDKDIPSGVVADLVHSFVGLASTVLTYLSLATPVAVGLAILNARGLSFAVSGYEGHSLRRWTEQHLELPLWYAQHLPAEQGLIVGQLNDRLCNAFGLERSPYSQ